MELVRELMERNVELVREPMELVDMMTLFLGLIILLSRLR